MRINFHLSPLHIVLFLLLCIFISIKKKKKEASQNSSILWSISPFTTLNQFSRLNKLLFVVYNQHRKAPQKGLILWLCWSLLNDLEVYFSKCNNILPGSSTFIKAAAGERKRRRSYVNMYVFMDLNRAICFCSHLYPAH